MWPPAPVWTESLKSVWGSHQPSHEQSQALLSLPQGPAYSPFPKGSFRQPLKCGVPPPLTLTLDLAPLCLPTSGPLSGCCWFLMGGYRLGPQNRQVTKFKNCSCKLRLRAAQGFGENLTGSWPWGSCLRDRGRTGWGGCGQALGVLFHCWREPGMGQRLFSMKDRNYHDRSPTLGLGFQKNSEIL